MFCLYTFPLARPGQAKIQNLTAIGCIVKLIPWNVVDLSHLYIGGYPNTHCRITLLRQKSNNKNDSFMASEPPKFCWSSNIFLTKYQLSVFLMFIFCWENKFLIGQSTKIFSVKTGFEELKKKSKQTSHSARSYVQTTNTNLEFLQQIFCSFTFWVFLQGKLFLIF